MNQVVEMQRGVTQMATFRLGDDWYGIDVLAVQEVLFPLQLETVPGAPKVVAGLLNVRGVIMTNLSLKARLGLPDDSYSDEYFNIILTCDDGHVCVMVDEIGDVVSTASHQLYPPPISDAPSEALDCILGVYQINDRLFALLDAALITAA